MSQALFPPHQQTKGAIAAKIRTQAEASAIVALRRNCIHASRPKCPLLRIGNRSPSNAAAFKPIQSPCSNGAAHCAVATRRHRQPSQAKRLSGSECRSARAFACTPECRSRAKQRMPVFIDALCSSIWRLCLRARKSEGAVYKVRAGSVRPY
ncbi:hypothetical protein [Xanthomonas arboricola]|uniref:hypothetical protein n=1 Tax=Xanthomonas arboricola TaxID=56448 RepID=UPI0015CE08F2